MSQHPFTRAEALDWWSRMVAGWAHRLDSSGARTLLDGVPNPEDAGGSPEGVTRMLWGLGGWLSQDRETELRWRGEIFKPDVLTKRALIGGTDPNSLGYWGRKPNRGEYDQRTVESGQVAFATWQSRQHSWDTMTPQEQANLVAWLERFGQKPASWNNNWALFWLLNHAGRKHLGAAYDQAMMDSVLEYLEDVYCANGWYDDGKQRGANHFDDYNYWVFATHVLAWAQMDGDTQLERRDLLLERIEKLMVHFPYFFAAKGAYTEYGRSLSYKFARLAAPLWAYKAGVWPHSIGMLRRLVGRHMRWYLDWGALRADGTLRQSLTAEGSVEVRETYIATGSSYWATLAFGALWSLPDDDPFWTTPEEPLPVEQANFTTVYKEPGWVVVGDKQSGEVQRFSARSEKHPSKYGKYLYATAAPFNIGQVGGQYSPDNMLSLSDGETHAHRDKNLASGVGEPGWLRMRYSQSLEGNTHLIDTTIITRGEWHLRAHRVTLDKNTEGSVSVSEGSSPLGYVAGSSPFIQSSKVQGWEKATEFGRPEEGNRQVGIMRLKGYDGQQRARAWQGRHDLNSVYGHYVLPLLTVSKLEPSHDLICLVYVGKSNMDFETVATSIKEATWLEDGTFRLELTNGSVVEVPAV